MTRRELMERLGADELREQLAFERIYPFEDGYWQAAQVAFLVCKALGAKSLRFEDLLPRKVAPKATRKPTAKGGPAVPGKIRVDPAVIGIIQRSKSGAA